MTDYQHKIAVYKLYYISKTSFSCTAINFVILSLSYTIPFPKCSNYWETAQVQCSKYHRKNFIWQWWQEGGSKSQGFATTAFIKYNFVWAIGMWCTFNCTMSGQWFERKMGIRTCKQFQSRNYEKSSECLIIAENKCLPVERLRSRVTNLHRVNIFFTLIC